MSKVVQNYMIWNRNITDWETHIPNDRDIPNRGGAFAQSIS